MSQLPSEPGLLEQAIAVRRISGWLLFVLVLVVFPLLIVASGILGGFMAILMFGKEAVTSPATAPAASTAFRSGIELLGLLFSGFAPIYLFLGLWVWLFERRSFLTLGYGLKQAPVRYLRGFALGLLAFGVVTAGLALTGSGILEEGPAEMQGLPAAGGVAIVLLGWIVQGGAEEVMCRGWLLQIIGVRLGPWPGIIISSLVFSLLHGLNPDVSVIAFANIFLVGVMLSLYALREGSIWGVSAWHAAWNWAQGNIFGFEVSGVAAKGGSLINMTAGEPSWASGGHFGPEAGLATTLLLAGTIAYLLRRNQLEGRDFRVPPRALVPPDQTGIASHQ